jgi:hypothetical protein
MAGPFEIQLRQFAEKAKANAEAVTRKVIADVGAEVVLRSPVDKGDFRRAWVYSVDAPDASIGRQGFTASLAAMPAVALGRVHFITNASPQAWTLEHGGYPNPPKNPSGKTLNGFSVQAPAGMVGLTVIRFNDFIREACREVNP